MAVVAVVLAGGLGTRSGLDVPKQLFPIGDRTVLGHAIEAFRSHEGVDRIVVTVPAEWRETIAALEPDVDVVVGGATRQLSVVAGLADLNDDDLVLIHDAARPFLPRAVIDRCLAALGEHDAVGTVVESTDTVYRLDPLRHELQEVPERATLRRAQTPQAFRVGVVKEAHRIAAAAGAEVTDDCSVVLHHLPDVAIVLVDGDVSNVKLTTPEDFAAIPQS